MAAWMKTLAAGLCILTILLHLIPGGKYLRYVRFYAGLLFFLLAVSPVLKWFGSEEQLDRLLELAFLQEAYYDMETAARGMAELKNETIREAYCAELTRQVTELAAACGLPVSRAQLTFSGDGYSVERILLWTDGPASAEAAALARSEISELYLLPEERILVQDSG